MYNSYGYGSYGTTASSTQAAAGIGGLIAGMLGFFIFLIVVCAAAAIVVMIAKMAIYKKAGKPSWAAWVPGYSSVLDCEIGGVDPRWVLIYIYGSFLSIIPILGGLAYAAAAIYYAILVNVSLAHSFGKSTGFAVGLILVPFVFIPMLGWGQAKYDKPTPMNDFLFGKKKA
jgi:hypothetical protein